MNCGGCFSGEKSRFLTISVIRTKVIYLAHDVVVCIIMIEINQVVRKCFNLLSCDNGIGEVLISKHAIADVMILVFVIC